MKQFLSVFALTAENTLRKILLTLVAAAAAETAVFILQLKNAVNASAFFSEIISNRIYQAVFSAAFLLILFIILRFSGKSGRCRPDYTLARLSVSRKQVSSAAALYTICCLTMLWAVQTGLLLAFCIFYTERITDYEPAFFMTASADPFLHGLFPYGYPLIHLRNLLMIAGTGLAAGCHAVCKNDIIEKYFTLISAAVFLLTLPVNTEPSVVSGQSTIFSYITGPLLIILHLSYFTKKNQSPVSEDSSVSMSFQNERGELQ